MFHMKSAACALFAGFLLTASAWSTPPKPQYTAKSAEVVGDYTPLPGQDCWQMELCEKVTITSTPRGLMLIADNEFRRIVTSLRATPQGTLLFKWTNPVWERCDDPGCGDLRSLGGVIYPKLIDDQWVPAMKLHLNYEYRFPVEVDDPNGEVTKTFSLIKQ